MKSLGKYILVVSFFVPKISYAQATRFDPDLQWQDHKDLANAISFAGPIAAITLDTIHSFRAEDKKRALLRQVVKTGILLGAAELSKRIVHRTRPDESDNKSFFSEHTELSASLFGSNKSLSIILTFNTAALRNVAGKHFLTDTIVGAVIGSVVGEAMK